MTTIFRVASAAVLGLATSGAWATGRELSFEERLRAQTSIERVYHSHQLDAKRSFEEAVPPALVEHKVRTYLAQSAALEQLWATPIDAGDLERELERMARGTRMPERLLELYHALDDDPVLIAECLARPALVQRLVHAFFARDERIPTPKRSYDAWWREIEAGLATTSIATEAFDRPLPLPDDGAATTTGASLVDRWDNGSLDDVPDSRTNATAVWTGSVMLLWGGGRSNFATATSHKLDTGHRYDPATDSWTTMASANAPAARQDHTAIWTGDVMVVWGGFGSGPLSSGGRYDPVSNSWSATATAGAPAARSKHTALWTGSTMIVWGGVGASGNLNSGSRYDPASNAWSAVTNSGAPTARSDYSAVWTGSTMVIWGGRSSGYLATGAQYDPSSNSWSPTATTNAPSARAEHAAVWTRDEMVVWGGVGGATSNSGGRYDPASDSWQAISTVGAPSGRPRPSAVWTGSVMLVWGGDTEPKHGGGLGPGTGGRYDPATDTWASISTTNAPSPRMLHSAVWADGLMLVWGGVYGGFPYELAYSGGRYDPAADSWTPISTGSGPVARAEHTAVWTGTRMLVWGGETVTAGTTDSGSQYDPALDTWFAMSTEGAPTPRQYHTAVWSGESMIVWGGGSASTGGRYDPLTDSWLPTSTVSAPSGRFGHSAIWIGDSMLIWGGITWSPSGYTATGGRYDPSTDSWTATSTSNAPEERYGHTAVRAGNTMIVWGGWADNNFATGGIYDLATDSWSETSTIDAPSGRLDHTAVWTGDAMLVWGGETVAVQNVYHDTGGRYDPSLDQWSPLALTNAPSARSGHTAVWTGFEMLVWGGRNANSIFASGARYDAAANAWSAMSKSAEPLNRILHTAVWADSVMIVWGGGGGFGSPYFLGSGGRYGFLDTDLDGVPNAQDSDDDNDGAGDALDCAQFDAGAYAVPAEVDGLSFGPSNETLSWTSATAGAGTSTVHDVLRASLAALPIGQASMTTCLVAGHASPMIDDEEIPRVGSGFVYLVRGRNTCGSGTYGQQSNGDEQVSTACP